MLPTSWGLFLHLVTWGLFLGMLIWHSFIAGPRLFKKLPKANFSEVQGVLFPVFFQLSSLLTLVLIGLTFSAPWNGSESQLLVLGVVLAASLLNMVAVGPRVTKIMWDRAALLKAEKVDQEAVARVQKQFGKIHGMSVLLNLVVIIGVLLHGAALSNRIAKP